MTNPKTKPLPLSDDLEPFAANLPVVVVTVEQEQILDVRVASRDFLLAVLAGNNGGNSCANAGRYPWLLG